MKDSALLLMGIERGLRIAVCSRVRMHWVAYAVDKVHVSTYFHRLCPTPTRFVPSVSEQDRSHFCSSRAEMILVPCSLAGLNERSQSAYAAPRPKPVDSEMGHVRPMWQKSVATRLIP